MANCIIYEKGLNEILHFIKNCTQNGRDFKGDNLSLTGVKEYLFDVKWTEEILIQDKDGNWNKRVLEVSDALRYENVVVSNREDVDKVTISKIREKYSINEENKILRLQLSGDSSLFDEYNKFVTDLVNRGKGFKDKHFPRKEN